MQELRPLFDALSSQYFPHRYDVAGGASQDEEMKNGMCIVLSTESVEHGTSDVADALGDNPPQRGGAYGFCQWLEGHQHTQSHANEATGL